MIVLVLIRSLNIILITNSKIKTYFNAHLGLLLLRYWIEL